MTTLEIIRKTKAAWGSVRDGDAAAKNHILTAMADSLTAHTTEILQCNALDMDAAKERIPEVMLDRLRLDEGRIAAMADGIRATVKLPDHTGRILSEFHHANGMTIYKKQVPLGLVAIIYESRPNVTSDAAALAIKSGNVCVLRSGREAIRTSTRAEREAWIREARYNLFKLRSDQVTIDLLTDSGTGSMSDRQWAAMMTGDESYAGASSYFRLKETIESIFGMPYFLPTHQGRAAENVIFSALLKAGDIVPGNSHFDTTKGHIEFRRCHAVDCTIDDAADTQKELPFKGEMDIAKLEKLLRENPREKVPCVVLTITNNTAGGQPVSMRNIRETAEVCRRYGVPLLLDSARFAENAYFIKTREEGYADKTIKEIVREIYTYADIMTISAKKDGVVNMGGFVAMRSEELYRQAMTFSIMFEGYVTYGGMSGRDMDALAVGLDENTEYEQLDARIRQVKLLGDLLDEYGVPYQRPAGGHAIFVDAKKVLPNLPKEQFIAQTLAVELYLEAGIRGVEIGSILADRDPDTHENRYPRLELLRLAIPRRVYSDNHIRVIAAACRNIYERRAEITTGYRITFEAPILRHFTVELDKI